MVYKFIIYLMLVLVVTGYSTEEIKASENISNTSKTTFLYNQFIKGEPPSISQLNLFFTQMPKGGDLHHHYSGSIYAETYLDWVKEADYCIYKDSFRINRKNKDNCFTVDDIRSKPWFYRKLLTLWSAKDYQNHDYSQLPPDSNFFNTFGYFGPISRLPNSNGLNILKERAKKENVGYIETMINSVCFSSDDSFDEKLRASINDKAILYLLDRQILKITEDARFQQCADKFVRVIEKSHKGLDDADFMLRFQTHASRNSSPSKVFSALYSAFKSAEISELVVGVNIVGPENGIIAIGDYHLHMLMFSYLKSKFPNVNRALHAGELTLGMVRPKNLKFHITQAIEIAVAQRIGHGIDLPYEDDVFNLLEKIKETSVVEINLTSNEFILGVKGKKHPYLIYSAYDVPIVISSDDSGVSRNNLSSEYVLLSSRYKPSYKTIKKYAYNSIKYSFLSDIQKKLLTSSLDTRFMKFESDMAIYYDTLIH